MRISQEKKDKITEQILSYLFSTFPNYPFTAEIAKEIARDEEFVKKLMLELEKNELVSSIKKNTQGDIFSRRIRWRLSNKVYEIYRARQNN